MPDACLFEGPELSPEWPGAPGRWCASAMNLLTTGSCEMPDCSGASEGPDGTTVGVVKLGGRLKATERSLVAC